jgi:hypothetical protein
MRRGEGEKPKQQQQNQPDQQTTDSSLANAHSNNTPSLKNIIKIESVLKNMTPNNGAFKK